jgi:cell division protein FtsW
VLILQQLIARIFRSCAAERSSDKDGVGTSIFRLRLQDLLLFCVLALVGLGVVMVHSAAINVGTHWVVTGTEVGSSTQQKFDVKTSSESSARRWAQDRGITVVSIEPSEPRWTWTERGTRHLTYAIFALVAFLVVGHLDYYRLLPRATSFTNPILWALALSIIACALVLVPGIGVEVNGARRWLPVGPLQVQPSEIAKWSIVIFLAWWLTNPSIRVQKFWVFAVTLVPVGAICLLIAIQDFGTSALIAMVSVVILIAARARWIHLAFAIPPALIAAIAFVISKEYRWKRMTAFLDPWNNPQTDGYHMIQSLLSFSTGGITGKGLGNGIQKLGYLPEDTTDFIFAVISEELGLFGAMLIVTLYLGILYIAWQSVRQKRDSFGRMLAFGIGAMIGMQAVINIAVATVSVPTKGIPLPLVSAGGSGLIITCAALGLLYSITRHRHSRENLAFSDEREDRFAQQISTSKLALSGVFKPQAQP